MRFAKYYSNDFQGAIKDYNKAIELDPNYAIFYNNRGNAKFALNNLKSAIDDYNKAIKLNKSFTEAYRQKFKLVFNIKEILSTSKYKNPLNILLKALKFCEQDKDILFTALSFAYFSQNDYKKALKYANEAILFNNKNGSGYYRKYCALTTLCKQDKARVYLEKANKYGYDECF